MGNRTAAFFVVAASVGLSAACGSSGDNLFTQQSQGGSAGNAGASGQAGTSPGGSGGVPTDAAPDQSLVDATAGTGGGPADAGDGGAVGEVGAPCDKKGELACNGHAQKLQLICDGAKWVSNGVCSGAQLCSTEPGIKAGSCQDPVPGCAGKNPGDAVCVGADRRVCGPDLVTSTLETCKSAQHCALGTGPKCAMCLDGERICDGADLKTCGSDHQSWLLVSACGSPALCNAAAGNCTPPACQPGQHRCTGDLLEKCKQDQTGFEPALNCLPGLCDAQGKQCDICKPGEASCVNTTTRQECSTDGQKLTSSACPVQQPYCSGAGQCKACSPTVSDQTLKPLDMYWMVDRSGSMTGTLWTATTAALKTYLQDPQSSGVTVALRFFPIGDTTTPQNPQCSGAGYDVPLIDWSLLPGGSANLTAAINAAASNGAHTPTQEAVNGALQAVKTRLQVNPSRQVIAVFFSDGQPCCTSCPIETAPGIGQIAGTYFAGTPRVRSYAVSVASAADAVMDAIAQQGGGKSYLTYGQQAAIHNALLDIQKSATPCEFSVPGGSADPSKVTVTWVPTAPGQPKPLPAFSGPGACIGDGWFFDTTQSPPVISLCPTSCTAMRADPASKVTIQVDTCQ